MNKKNEKFWRIVFVLFLLGLFGAFFLWSMMQPFGAPPDEKERFKIVEFIVKHGKLPHGGDPEILLYGWGFSYGFQPILSYIFSAGIVKVVSLFSDSEYIQYNVVIPLKYVSMGEDIFDSAMSFRYAE